MLFYRALNVTIVATEIYYLRMLEDNNTDDSGKAVGIFGFMLLYANFIVALVFLVSEIFFPHDSATLQKVKASYPYTETPLKIALLYSIGVSCAKESNLFFTGLQTYVLLDLVVSYLSYAWKTFWPIIIIPTNKALINVNAAVLYLMRITRGLRVFFMPATFSTYLTLSLSRTHTDMIYSFYVWLLDQFFWIKFEFDLKCCKIREGEPVPIGRKISNLCSKTITFTCDGIEFVLQASGIEVERADVGCCCWFSIQCTPSLKIILPRYNVNVYEAIEEAVVPEPPQNLDYNLGFLQHVKTGRYVHPEGGEGVHHAKLILGPPVQDPAFIFRFHKDGSLEHDQTELFVHPDKGAANPGHNVILHDGGHHKRLAWQLHADGAFEHNLSHLFVHVEEKQGLDEKSYLFLSTIGHQDSLAFKMIPFKPGSERRCLNNHIMRYRLHLLLRRKKYYN